MFQYNSYCSKVISVSLVLRKFVQSFPIMSVSLLLTLVINKRKILPYLGKILMPEASTERIRAFRERKGAENRRKQASKSGDQRAREFRARQYVLKTQQLL